MKETAMAMSGPTFGGRKLNRDVVDPHIPTRTPTEMSNKQTHIEIIL